MGFFSACKIGQKPFGPQIATELRGKKLGGQNFYIDWCEIVEVQMTMSDRTFVQKT